jgi:hypothetical protein
MSKPTLGVRALGYENLLFRINAARQVGDVQRVQKLLNAIDDWCWAHRDGNGTLSDRQVRKQVNDAFWRMMNA